MNLEEFVNNGVAELIYPTDLDSSTRALGLAIDVALTLSHAQKGQILPERIADAGHLAQITILRSISLLNLARGIEHENELEAAATLGLTVDPASAWTLVRSQFEATAILNSFFIQHEKEEQIFLHRLWVIGSLKTRQRFAEGLKDPAVAVHLTAEEKSKPYKELQELNELLDVFRAMPLYQNATPEKLKEIERALKERKYQFAFVNGVPVYHSWEGLFKRFVKMEAFNRFYPFLCSWAHPSYLSVFQFKGMFSQGEHINAVRTAINLSTFLLALTIQDQITIAPQLQIVYEALPANVRSLITYWNSFLRE